MKTILNSHVSSGLFRHPMKVVAHCLPLSEADTGAPMIVVEVRDAAGVPELPARLRELGFVEGEAVRVLRRGQPGGEPLAVRVGVSTFALRRAEAHCVLVAPAGGGRT
jgi:ferrous iron transport protein A